jgi:hypothetical protein
VELDCIGSIDRLWLFIKRNSENEHEDLMEKLGQLVIDVDYIKNTVKELREGSNSQLIDCWREVCPW